jgi:type 1 fimbria pilin
MKKVTFAKCAALVVAGVLSQGASAAADGTINFTGEITDQICSVSANSQNMIVPLGKVSKSVFGTTAGAKSTPAHFKIDLLNCPAGSNGAHVTFQGTANSVNSKLLRINNAGEVGVLAATGVGVELSDSTGTPFALGSESPRYPLGEGDNSLKFQAAYVSTGTAVTVGPANATAQFTVSYK